MTAPLLASPGIATHGRYQISATLGGNTVITYTDDLDAARAAFETAFARPNAGNTDATGGIYDMQAARTVLRWRGGQKPRVDAEAEFTAWLDGLRRTAPVLVVNGGRATEFSQVGGAE